MNPPSAIHSAMSRDRKPFTYTPGGLDLSEIKSERMAKRLMRNAMNQGVPEVPMHSIQSPPMPSTPILVPNYNCLPVQVFPTFNLPANPKSLLRTRSHADQSRDVAVQRVLAPPHSVNNTKSPGVVTYDTFSSPTHTYTPINNNRPVSMYEYGTTTSNDYSLPRTNHGSDGFKAPAFPEISYDAEYFRVPPNMENIIDSKRLTPPKHNDDEKLNDVHLDTVMDLSMIPTLATSFDPAPINSKPAEDDAVTDKKQREVKVVKKTVTKEQKTEEQNGGQNGDSSIEAELTVKLPTKKTGAKTETKVEVVKKILPDGTVEEVKTTTTKTTIDGKTEIKTKTETRTLPKEEADEEVEEEEEEEEVEENDKVIVQEVEDEKEEIEEPKPVVKKTKTEEDLPVKENGAHDKIVKTEERSDTTTTTTKKVVVVQSDTEEPVEEIEEEEVEEEEDEVEDVEPVTVVIKKEPQKASVPEPEPKEVEVEEEEEEEDVKSFESIKKDIKQKVEQEDVEEEEEVEEVEEIPVKKGDSEVTQKTEVEQEEEEEEEEYEEAEEKQIEIEVKKQQEVENEKKVDETQDKEKEQVEEVVETIKVKEPESSPVEETKVTEEKETPKKEVPEQISEPNNEIPEDKEEIPAPQPEPKAPLREPSIPLEKVEDVEIKPIGPAEVITKTHTEKTEIITSTAVPPPGVLSTQTEYNRVENIVTVNRTTKTLDNAYENMTQQGIPTVKTYFAPNIDRVLTSPMPSRPYQPVYTAEPKSERRHSLLLERLSMERQMPSEIYQYNNQTYEQQRQCSQEPQAEVLTISNVKPSTITNQQWYQQSRENAIYNNVTPIPAPTPAAAPAPAPAPQTWSQAQPKPQPQQTYKPQPTYPPQQTYQPPPTPQPQYQPSYTETLQDATPNTYTAYTPKPSNWTSSTVDTTPSINTQPNQYSFLNRDSSESYQKTTQQYSSSYVPPPWEQDSSYVVDNSTQNYYQPPPTNTLAPTPIATQSWKPPTNKFSKPPPTAYIPPAPNQSFVKPVTSSEPAILPGRKTYYSEYERRYISVPESTYIPNETKYQPQPDPSPQYYYDNNEATETVEHEWRKELREFTEKTSQTQTDQTNVKPPWEVDVKYAKTPASTYTPTPTWSQTLRPRSWRERSFESEYVGSQEWPKTNTLGRGRPLSTYAKNEPILERTRGVSVDRYNPNNYQSPTSLEHPPVPTHTLKPTPAAHSNYHNPNVPAYHARASAEPREQPASYKQPRAWREARASPLQSRSFKYLQWITGTDD